MENDLISRSALKNLITNMQTIGGEFNVLDVIDSIPAAEIPQGVWQPTGGKSEYWAPEYECSLCGTLQHWSKYCPNCGAKMADLPKPKEPIKAMWISGAKDPTGQYFEDEVMCSNCMHSEPQSYMFKENGMICPRCGATMERGPRV